MRLDRAVGRPDVEDSTGEALIRLADLRDGVEGTFFALLASRKRETSKRGEPYYRCEFADRAIRREVMVWANSPHIAAAAAWVEGDAYRIRGRGILSKYGQQVEVLEIRPASAEHDGADGFRFNELVEGSKYDAGQLLERVREFIRKMKDRRLAELVTRVVEDNAESLRRMPAASRMHHAFIGGLIEHVWSVTRAADRLARHYAEYYDQLDPPLNCDVIVAGAILHDIGKLRELQAHSIEAKYTTEGTLIGHILLGRDMVREAARQMGDFDPETLMLLEHTILAHHGKRELGSPVEPSTLEALILSYVDDLDAKLNAAFRGRQAEDTSGDGFTEKIWSVNNRRFYRGVAKVPPANEENGCP